MNLTSYFIWLFFTYIFIHQGKKASSYYTLLIILYFTEEEEENEEVKRKEGLGRSLSEQSNLGVNVNL